MRAGHPTTRPGPQHSMGRRKGRKHSDQLHQSRMPVVGSQQRSLRHLAPLSHPLTPQPVPHPQCPGVELLSPRSHRTPRHPGRGVRQSSNWGHVYGFATFQELSLPHRLPWVSGRSVGHVCQPPRRIVSPIGWPGAAPRLPRTKRAVNVPRGGGGGG